MINSKNSTLYNSSILNFVQAWTHLPQFHLPNTATDTYAYPSTSNRLSTVTLGAGGSRAFTYDGMGDVTNEVRTGGAYSYTYDSAGRMATFSINGVLQAAYKYDFAGRQVVRSLTSPTPVTLQSVFDSDGNRIAEYNEATGALIREYVWLNGEPLAVIEGGVVNYIRVDHIDRPVFATNSAGTKTWTATYLPFGEVRTTSGTPIALRFPGQWFQSESGLHQNWMRDYDPTTGRYLEADPLGLVDGACVYGYVKGNPGRYSDRMGLSFRGPAPGSIESGNGCGSDDPDLLILAQEFFFEVPPWFYFEDPIPPYFPRGSSGGPGGGKNFNPGKIGPGPDDPMPDCTYCGKPTTREPGPDQLNRDHIVPKSQGGNNTPENYAPLGLKFQVQRLI